MIMPMIIDDLKLTPTQNAVTRIMLRYGIISIRQAAKLAHPALSLLLKFGMRLFQNFALFRCQRRQCFG